MKILSVLLVLLVTVGCAQQKPKSEPSVNVSEYLYQVNAVKVKNGMSESEVVAIMGDKPSSRSASNLSKQEIKALIWTHYNPATRKAYAVSFQFVDDKVTGKSETGLN